ncbi:MAG: ABC transporter permease [Bacteroidales bacterium]|nr:ABC transporter permease [Bacteroidales bacterium]
MIRNYFITAIRNMLRHKSFTAIIVIGLTIGIAIFGLVLTYVNNEFSYDRFNEHYESIYRLEHGEWALLGTAYGPEIGQQFPEIENAARVSIMEGQEVTLKIEDRMMTMNDLVYADSNFFEIFSFRFLKGNPKYCLNTPNAIVLTKSMARRIFGDEDPMNKSIKVNNKVVYTVTGIIEDVSRFHLNVNGVVSFLSLKEVYDNPNFLNQYGMWNYYTYLLLKTNTDAGKLAGKINEYYANRFNDDEPPQFSFRPLKELYFAHVKYDMPHNSASRSMLYIYLVVAIFILIIACVNFVNLSIAKATTRSREIGVRKASGADRQHLIIQFIGESVLYALIATELSLVLMELLRPVFNNLVQRQLTLLSLHWGWIVFLILLIPLIIGLLAGIYPALYLTRFGAIATMKKEQTRGKASVFFRQSLIILQFLISTMLIIGTLTVYKQMKFTRKADLGYSKDNIVLLHMNPSLYAHWQAFKDLLISSPDISGVSLSTQSLENVSWQEGIEIDASNKQFTYVGVDTAFIPMMQIKISEGRNFQPLSSDSSKCIINKAAIDYFGLKAPVIGQVIGTGDRRMEVLGVTEDFHISSLHSPIAPVVMSLRGGWLNTVNIKVNHHDLPGTMKFIEASWNKVCPETLFRYRFLDESYVNLYNDDMRLGRTFVYLALLAIFIACIGLLGLSSFLAEQRIKEIGVRKAMGDTTTGIIVLFSWEFGKWVFLAGIMAIPVAYLIMNKWLNTFAYRIQIDVWIMITACLITLATAILTVVIQTRKIAVRNPVEALRYE